MADNYGDLVGKIMIICDLMCDGYNLHIIKTKYHSLIPHSFWTDYNNTW